MADLFAEVRVIVHAHDQPAAFMDHEDIAVFPSGGPELVVYVAPPDAERWLRSLEASVLAALGKVPPLEPSSDQEAHPS